MNNTIENIYGIALGNAQWKVNKKRWIVKLRLDKPMVLPYKDGQNEYETVILSSSRNHTDCKDITYNDRIKFSGIIRSTTASNVMIDVSSYEGGTLDNIKRAARRDLARSCSIIGKDSEAV